MAGGGAPAAVTVSGPAITKRQEYFAFGLVTSLFFLWGFSYGLLDVLNSHFQQFFGITKLQSTMMQVAYFGAYIVYSPVAGQFISRFGYRNGIYMGLAFYCVGALCFWPSAKFESFPAFVVSAFVIACGLATLEVCANSYVTVLGSPEKAAFRLNFSQAFNGLASFIGPLIASKAFFSHDDVGKGSLNSVQFVYLGVACLGAAVMVLFFFAKLPEITEQDMADNQANAGYVDERPLWKRKHTVIGFVVQFCYVGAQVSTASFIINYLNDSKMYTKSQASQMFSYMQITFMVGRFVSTPLLRFFNDATILAVYGTMCATFSLVAALTGGKPGLASLFIVFFFESVCYPTTFTLATSNLGIWTKRGASLVVMGVGGGAAFPPMQGALADARSTELSYVINAVGFLTVAAYGVGMRLYQRRFAHMVANASLEAAVLPASSSKEKLDDESEKIETSTLHI